MADLDEATRELWLRTVEAEVIQKDPLLNRLLARRQITWRGGTKIKRPVDTDEYTDIHGGSTIAQSYAPNEQLRGGSKDVLQTPEFNWKFFQIPVEYTAEERVKNHLAGDWQIVDLAEFRVAKAQRAARTHLKQMIYEAGSATSDSDIGFQGLADALTHDLTYGTIPRSGTTTNKWWQGASITGGYDDYNTARSPSIANFRKAKAACMLYSDAEGPGDLMVITSSTIFQALQSEAETMHIYSRDGSEMAKQGFNAMVLDGVEIVEEPYLEISPTRRKYFFVLNLATWELRLFPERSFELTPFVWQGELANGYDKWLARILVAGNLVCWKPNANLFNSNWS